MKHKDLIAIDIHPHPTIDETVADYREREIEWVMFTVDSESQLGRRRISMARRRIERGHVQTQRVDRTLRLEPQVLS